MTSYPVQRVIEGPLLVPGKLHTMRRGYINATNGNMDASGSVGNNFASAVALVTQQLQCPLEPIAIPLPYRYWSSLDPTIRGGDIASFIPGKVAAIGNAANDIADPENYALLIGMQLVTHRLYDSGTAYNYTFRIMLSPFVNIEILQSGPVKTVISATITVSGAGGFVLMRTFQPFERPTLSVTIPTPWDENRTLTVTWTGGSGDRPTVDVPQFTQRLLRRGPLRAGWTACQTLVSRRLDPQTLSMRYMRAMPISSVEMIDANISDGSTTANVVTEWQPQAVYTSRQHRSIGTCDSVILSRGGETVDKTQIAKIMQVSSKFAPYSGIPVWDGAKWIRVHGELPTSGEIYMYDGDGLILPVRHLTALSLVVNHSGPDAAHAFNITVKRTPDWDIPNSNNLASVTIYSGAFAKSTYDNEVIVVPMSFPLMRHADAAISGVIQILLSDPAHTHAVSIQAVMAHEHNAPLPVNISVTDGDIIAGGLHADNSVTALGIAAVSTSGLTLVPSDVAVGMKAFNLRFASVSAAGAYVIRTTGALGTTAVQSAMVGSVGRFDNRNVWSRIFMVPAGADVYAVPPTGWWNYGRSLVPIVESITLTPIAIAPNALAIGSQNLAVNASTWGLADTVSGCQSFLFQKFVAPSDGVYSFKLHASGELYGRGCARFAAWVSLTDPVCPIDAAPDYLDKFFGWYVNQRNPVITAIPAVTPGQYYGNREYLVGAGATGLLAGHDHELATYVEPYVAGFTDYDVTFESPPEGAIIQTDTRYLQKTRGVWVNRTDEYLSFSRSLTAGQTLYMRIGTLSPTRAGIVQGSISHGLTQDYGTDYWKLLMDVSVT